MTYNPPFEYTITPETVEPGTHWVSIHLKNIGKKPMMNLDVRMISNDSLRIRTLDRGGYVNMLNPGEERVIPVQIESNRGAWVYLHVEYWLDVELFHWESPNVWIKVRRDPARIITLFSMEGPEYKIDELASIEATIIANLPTDTLQLDFWLETADGDFESFKTIDVGPLDTGEYKKITTKFVPEMEGLYSIYTYLFDGNRRVDRKIEQVRVLNP